jgi:hypothetical protein
MACASRPPRAVVVSCLPEPWLGCSGHRLPGCLATGPITTRSGPQETHRIVWGVAALGAGRGLACVVVPPARILVTGRDAAHHRRELGPGAGTGRLSGPSAAGYLAELR